MSDVPEQQAPAPVAPMTRRERRARSRNTPAVLPKRALLARPLTMATTIAFAALVGLTGYASPDFVAVAVALAGLVLAWGWPQLLSLPSPRGTSAVLAVGTVLMTASVLLTREAPYLQWLPAALAVSVIAAFLHQLMRRDGRPRLTESVTSSVTGLAVVSAGIALAPVPQILHGEHALAAAMAGLGFGVLADPLIKVQRLRQWALFISMVVGGAAGMVVSVLAGHPKPWPAALLGLLAAAVAHAARRVMAVLPATAMPRAQLAVGASSSLLVGVVAYVVVRSPFFA
ncbi:MULTISPECIES: hypothetical protein [unclassified Phycicoccus]|uniref:hypothetical protein n=1 Tax=unclassified Phycicoccus TaxID=2637926 RepID=UPI0007035C00|nr:MULTISPECIES: hypothetical protein [unclassified Phycicoccus]KQU67438.1 hypothetical protein ASC58_12760 [Phycicoccus sp. Root101]KQZ90118.1 hypothetical protein ASD62_13225 [Phycicoccus sp. Root563]